MSSYKTKSRTKGTRLSTKQIVRGVQMAEYNGTHHRQETYTNGVGANPRTEAMNKKKHHMEKEEYDKGGYKLNPKLTAENEFLSASSSMRGKQLSKTFQGKNQSIFMWNASEHLRPEAVGGGQFHGAFSGGDSKLKAMSSKSTPHIGHQSGKKNLNGEGLHTVNPFSIKLKVKGSSLKIRKH